VLRHTAVRTPAPPTGVTPATADGNAAVDVPPPAAAAAEAGAPGEEDLGALLDAVVAGERFFSAVDAACHAAVQLPVGGVPADVHLTADVRPGDARIASARFKAAARDEVDVLLAGGAVRPVIRSAVPKGANVIRGRFVFTLKGVGTADERPKAR